MSLFFLSTVVLLFTTVKPFVVERTLQLTTCGVFLKVTYISDYLYTYLVTYFLNTKIQENFKIFKLDMRVHGGNN